ncbi:TadE family type IV pilus minor pilin [Catenuloplanes indicus]|uniref:Mucin-associated surface protein n=1 Tax=Catenuloplanes indicus TaxID=137267 RepID=A0AAE3W124_9ACTN|nr:TadE family type IV pilus minor pilin [Catenuloplanes indicus]MDQ0367370.1 hypothetical protein [Catenuloplanes indicus]
MITRDVAALRYRGRHHRRSRIAHLLDAVTSAVRLNRSGTPVTPTGASPPSTESAVGARVASSTIATAAPGVLGTENAASARTNEQPMDRGAFTAEFAAALPALVLLLGAGLTAVTAVTDRGRCYDAARDAALAAARGESGMDAGTAAAPPGATVTLVPEGEHVRAVVTVPVRALGLKIPEITATGEAIAAIEPGVTVTTE